MTRPELRSAYPNLATALDTVEFRAALDTAREECPFTQDKDRDNHASVRNEGKVVGWMEALRFLRHIWREPTQITAPTQTEHYRDPDSRKVPPKPKS